MAELGPVTRAEKAERRLKRLLGAVKQHRQATESRLRLLDSRGEAGKSMLKPDRDLYDEVEAIEAEVAT